MAGTAQLEISLAPGATVRDVKAHLIARFPDLAGLASTLAAAVNSEYADEEQVVNPGDEVAFIPPVSGGSGKWKCFVW
ncbi:MAG: MoaD/ThiS family protein [Candidatus Latescibacterota bacterium]|nr:MoaD/ThiS family protein [Candidatus Latescibacterota bacterium]